MATEKKTLDRFIKAQEHDFSAALSEIKNGRKRSHWMWYIFPQIHGLGFTETSRYYAILGLGEASEYLKHPILGSRLVQICSELLKLQGNNANSIFGSPDDLKLRSSVTLFASVPHADPVFRLVLEKFFDGIKDPKTTQILNQSGM